VGEILDQLDLKGHNDELVKELVELATRYGILTPYTSFLADEAVRPLAGPEVLSRTRRELSVLNESSGISGVAQRGEKGRFQNAQVATAPIKAAPAVAATGGMGMSSMSSAMATNSFRDARTDKEVAANSVRQYGGQAVYARKLPGAKKAEARSEAKHGAGEQAESSIVVTPETASLDLEKDKAIIEVIDRFTEPYFALIKANTVAENQILSQQRADEQLLIKLRGKNYLLR
jgi:Ca-activated chloride channel family protein